MKLASFDSDGTQYYSIGPSCGPCALRAEWYHNPFEAHLVTRTELWEIMDGKDGEEVNSNGLESSGSQSDVEGGKEDDDQQSDH